MCSACNARPAGAGGAPCDVCVALAADMAAMMAEADRAIVERDAAREAARRPKAKSPGRLVDNSPIPGVLPVPAIGPAPVAPLVNVRPKGPAVPPKQKVCHQCDRQFTPGPGTSPVRCEGCVKKNRDELRRFTAGGR